MKTKLFTALFLIATTVALAQTSTVNYWITFKDKNNSPYSVTKPEAYLSERSIARREKQHIAINPRDLPVNPAYIQRLQTAGATIGKRSKWFNAVMISVRDNSKLKEIGQLPFVKSIKKIEIIASPAAKAKFEPEEAAAAGPHPAELPALRSTTQVLNYGWAYNQAHQIGVDCMHEWGYMGQGMVIAEMDAGFYHADILPAFDSLRMNNQLLGCRDFVTGDTLVFEDYSHGMNVLSCMVGNLPGRIVGTAPKAKYWLLRTEDVATEGLHEEVNWAVAAEFADSVGADIITSSLGYSTGFTNPADEHTYADMDGNTTIITKAADWAAATGMFVVSSAGNSGGAPWYKITAPGDADSVLTIGAVDSIGNIAGFSSRGPTFDGRIKPNTVAKGVHATIAANEGDITFSGGTSFSCPITAGAVACLWQANPGRTNMEIMDAIQQSASQYTEPDTIKGYGIPNFCWANYILAGIPENSSSEENLNVYPNPFSSSFEINFYSAQKQEAVIQLMDVAGRIVSAQSKQLEMNSSNQFTITGTGNLSGGIYILQIRTKEKIYTRKIVKE